MPLNLFDNKQKIIYYPVFWKYSFMSNIGPYWFNYFSHSSIFMIVLLLKNFHGKEIKLQLLFYFETQGNKKDLF